MILDFQKNFAILEKLEQYYVLTKHIFCKMHLTYDATFEILISTFLHSQNLLNLFSFIIFSL